VNCAEIATKFLEGEEKHIANLNYSIDHPKGTSRHKHTHARTHTHTHTRTHTHTHTHAGQWNCDRRLSFFVSAAREANNYFLRAIKSSPHDSYAIFQYAQFLDRCGLIKKAEEFYLRSLEVRLLHDGINIPHLSRAAEPQQRGLPARVRELPGSPQERGERGREVLPPLVPVHPAAHRAHPLQVLLRHPHPPTPPPKFGGVAQVKLQMQNANANLRYGSRRDFQDLSQLSVSNFRERARNEIDLSSSPTLKLTSDEIKKEQRRTGGGGGGLASSHHQHQRSGESEALEEMENAGGQAQACDDGLSPYMGRNTHTEAVVATGPSP